MVLVCAKPCPAPVPRVVVRGGGGESYSAFCRSGPLTDGNVVSGTSPGTTLDGRAGMAVLVVDGYLDGAELSGNAEMIHANVLLTPTHPLAAGTRRDKLEAAKPISIGNNAWLGGGVIVLPGMSIGENTVVGAGAVVTRDLPANVVAVGNPARVVRDQS